MAVSKGKLWHLFHLGLSWLSLTWLAFIAGFLSLMMSWPETSGLRDDRLKESRCAGFALLIALVVGSLLHASLTRLGRRREIIRRIHLHFCGSVGTGMALGAATAAPMIYFGTPDDLRSIGDVPEGFVGGAGWGAILGLVIGTLWCLVEIVFWSTRDLAPPNRERARWAIALVPVVGLIAWAIAEACYPGRAFDAARWAEKESRHNGVRQQMAARLVGWRLLDGKTPAEVRSLLGKPNESAEGTWPRWLYFMGHERPFLYPLVEPPSCAWLMVEFGEDGRASQASVFAGSNCGCHDEPDELPGKAPTQQPLSTKR
jgi:hypothetical protein